MINNAFRCEDDQEKGEERFTKTGTHDHESPRELESQNEAQRMLAPQSEANVSRHKCNLNKNTPKGVYAGCVGVRKNYRYVQWQWKAESVSLHDRRFMSQAGQTRYFARSTTRARSARRGKEKNKAPVRSPLFLLFRPLTPTNINYPR